MKKIIFLFGLLTSLILSSCASNEIVIQPNAPVSFVAKTERKGDYSFIIPSNFQLIENESLVFENENIYRAYLVYKGEGYIQDLINFYDKEMPKAGWRRISALIGKGAILTFQKDSQIIVIKIQYGLTSTYLRMLLTR
jgi:hypothetical protein